jgi:citrate synthase
MTAATVESKIYKGLAGVVVDTTAISKVVPETNSLTYRGYPVQDLAAHCSFEQVAYLLWHGELPTDGELALFCQRERASRRIDRSLQSLLSKLPDTCHPMDVVRTAISYLGAEDP